MLVPVAPENHVRSGVLALHGYATAGVSAGLFGLGGRAADANSVAGEVGQGELVHPPWLISGRLIADRQAAGPAPPDNSSQGARRTDERSRHRRPDSHNSRS